MKLIAGSILASFGLLVIALGQITLSDSPRTRLYRPDFYVNIETPIVVLAIIFIVAGIGIICWGFWEARKKSISD